MFTKLSNILTFITNLINTKLSAHI